jgi:hypothetical protein
VWRAKCRIQATGTVDSVGAEHTMRAFLDEQSTGDLGMTHFIAQMGALDLTGVYRSARRLRCTPAPTWPPATTCIRRLHTKRRDSSSAI